MSLLVKVTILLGQNLLVFIQEIAEFIKFTVLKHLKSIESGRDLVRWWDFSHFRDRLVQ